MSSKSSPCALGNETSLLRLNLVHMWSHQVEKTKHRGLRRLNTSREIHNPVQAAAHASETHCNGPPHTFAWFVSNRPRHGLHQTGDLEHEVACPAVVHQNSLRCRPQGGRHVSSPGSDLVVIDKPLGPDPRISLSRSRSGAHIHTHKLSLSLSPSLSLSLSLSL